MKTSWKKKNIENVYQTTIENESIQNSKWRTNKLSKMGQETP